MKVIILKPIDNFKPGDVKDVADGYAKNFLIRNGYAKVATAENIKILEAQMEKIKKEEEKMMAELQKMADKLNGVEVKIPAKIGQ